MRDKAFIRSHSIQYYFEILKQKMKIKKKKYFTEINEKRNKNGKQVINIPILSFRRRKNIVYMHMYKSISKKSLFFQKKTFLNVFFKIELVSMVIG